MDDLNIIDRFTETFSTYIDSGFGLLGPDIAFLTSILVTIDIILAGLFWALMEEANVPAQLIRKVLYVGFFALLLNNFSGLADIVFQSFAGLGLRASNASFGADQLLRPGFVAANGFEAARPLLQEAGELVGFTSFFSNFVTIVVLLLAWLIVLLAFFILSVQLFITIIEFKLTTLVGFVLVPFALFGKTAFLAERVLGGVITAGIKLMVLAVVVGIGSGIFGELTITTDDISLEQAASITLAAIAVFGLSIFIPSIAAGLISGAPQLGAGSAAGTVAGLTASGVAGGLAVGGAVRLTGQAAGGSVEAASSMVGAARGAYQEEGIGGVMRVAVTQPMQQAGQKATTSISQAYEAGQQYGQHAARGGSVPEGLSEQNINQDPNKQPDWATQLRRNQHMREATMVMSHTLRDGDQPSSGEGPNLGDDNK